MSDKLKHKNQAVPSKYFETLPNRIMDSLSDLDTFEIENEAPILTSIGKENGFQVPPGYFSQFEVELPKQNDSFGKIVKFKRVMLAAASIILLVACLFVLTQKQDVDNNLAEADIEVLTESELLAYFDEANISEDLLLETLDDFDSQLDEVDITELVESNIDEFGILELETLF